MDLTLNNVSFGTQQRLLKGKAPKRFAYLLALGLGAMTLKSCDPYISNEDVYESQINPPTSNSYRMNDAQLNMVKNYYNQSVRPVRGIKLIDNGLKIFFDDWRRTSYDIDNDGSGNITLNGRYSTYWSCPHKITISPNKFGYELVAHSSYRNKNSEPFIKCTSSVLYDLNGNPLNDSQLANFQANDIKNTLDETKFFNEKDTHMLSSILSSWGCKKAEYLDLNGGLEVFADGKNATYDIVVRKSDDGSYWGIMNKLLSSGNLQSSKNEGSSQTYMFKIKNKSTSETERMVATVMRVERGDVNYDLEDDINNNQPKYIEGSSSHHKVDDYIVARGRAGLFSGGGVDIMATDEKTFTTKYLMGAESLLYTIESDGQ